MKPLGQCSHLLCGVVVLFAGCHLVAPYEAVKGSARQDGGEDAALDLTRDGNAWHDGQASVDGPDHHVTDTGPADGQTPVEVDPSACRRDPLLWECDADPDDGCFASCGPYGVACNANGNCSIFVPMVQLGCSLSSGALGCALCYEAAGDEGCWRS